MGILSINLVVDCSMKQEAALSEEDYTEKSLLSHEYVRTYVRTYVCTYHCVLMCRRGIVTKNVCCEGGWLVSENTCSGFILHMLSGLLFQRTGSQILEQAVVPLQWGFSAGCYMAVKGFFVPARYVRSRNRLKTFSPSRPECSGLL